MPDASGLFDPERVAVVGATERKGSIGRAIMRNLEDFDGEVVPVNPKREEVFGIPAVSSIDETAETVDLGIVVVPPSVAIDAITNLGKHGVRNVVVITAGFSEAGPEGAKLERKLIDVATEYDLNLVGPNSLGVMSTPGQLNATFGPAGARPGDISFMSQSGAFITAVIDWANDQDIGFKDVVSLGNKSILDETDFIETWNDDPATKVILGYLEGIENGRAFIENAQNVTKETPIVIVKSGRTEAGAQAASSHTGTIAGSEEAYEAGLQQAGVLRAENVQELFDYARILAGQPTPRGSGIAVVSNAGGPGVMTTDAIGDSGYDMVSFTDETKQQLKQSLPEGANIYNPVDIIGDADNTRFNEAIEIVMADPNVDALIVLASPIAVLDYEQLARDITTIADAYEIPTATALMGGERIERPAEILREAGIPNYFDPARAVDSLDALLTYRTRTELEYEPPTQFDVDTEHARAILEEASKRSNRIGVEAMDILDAYGIPTPEGTIVENPAAAVEVARTIDGPVVMKIVSPDILHKSDIGGVKVGVPLEDIEDAYEDLLTRARNFQPDADILGVQVQEMIDLDSGTETILGMNRDPQFGPLLLFGLGGIFVEVLEDTTIKVGPVSEREARSMIEEIQSSPLLRGARGRDPVDREAIVESVQRLSQLVEDFPAILEFDINPLVATPEGVQAVDCRLTIDPEQL
ncbi:MAG: acetate--CoA ligase family protein [Halodesulfurarchaeum sp.]